VDSAVGLGTITINMHHKKQVKEVKQPVTMMNRIPSLSLLTLAIASVLLNFHSAVGFQFSLTSISNTCAAAKQRKHRQLLDHHVLRRHAVGVGSADHGAIDAAVGDKHGAVLTPPSLSRRCLINQAVSYTMASSALMLTAPSTASAKVVATPVEATSTISIFPERDVLLQAIANKSSDTIIVEAINQLIPLSPLKGTSNTDKSAYTSALDGTWKLLWYNKSDFSPFLKLPSPLRPTSYQYFGSIAEKEVGAGRVAQGLVGGVVSFLGGGSDSELWLSSGAVPKENNPSILEIYPPFRFQLGKVPGSRGGEKRTIVESQSDAEFRAANGRSTEAQLAPKNEYEQLYLENNGVGSIRVSVLVKGDPVIVGEMFVHQKM
jgi:hypothetical protein